MTGRSALLVLAVASCVEGGAPPEASSPDGSCRVTVAVWVREFRDGRPADCDGDLEVLREGEAAELRACSSSALGSSVFVYEVATGEMHELEVRSRSGRAVEASRHWIPMTVGECDVRQAWRFISVSSGGSP
jgi:hypothetical protein